MIRWKLIDPLLGRWPPRDRSPVPPMVSPAFAPEGQAGLVRDLVRALDCAAPTGRRQPTDRSGLERAGIAGALRGATATGSAAGAAGRIAEARRRPAVAQSLRPSRPGDGDGARCGFIQPRPGSCRWGWLRCSEASASGRCVNSTGGRRQSWGATRWPPRRPSTSARGVRSIATSHSGADSRCGRRRWRAWFAGDTGYHPEFRAIGERLGPFDLALIPIGAYDPRWFMRPVHLDAEEAVQVALDLRAAHPSHPGGGGRSHPLGHLQAHRRADGRAAPPGPGSVGTGGA